MYLKEDAGKLLVGVFEPNAKPAFVNNYRVPEDFSFGELPEDFDHFEPYLINAMNRIPSLEKSGIRKFFNGPESFTPDTNYLLGETPSKKFIYVWRFQQYWNCKFRWCRQNNCRVDDEWRNI